MRTGRVTYLPIASIVVVIIILVVAVGLISFRDIARGRRQVADVLERQATAIARLLWADLRVQLGHVYAQYQSRLALTRSSRRDQLRGLGEVLSVSQRCTLDMTPSLSHSVPSSALFRGS